MKVFGPSAAFTTTQHHNESMIYFRILDEPDYGSCTISKDTEKQRLHDLG